MESEVDLREILDPQRVALNLPCMSKKRLLELVADLLASADDEEETDISQILNERERLGSTGIGHGIALPHGRVTGLGAPRAAFATFATPIDFDSSDGIPVSLVFAILVPEDANTQHLRLLAHLARMFSEPTLREELATCREPQEAYRILTEWRGPDST
ncbi:MAG: PTS sugar transporter subunit IIA [Gammaproteobacteria bacterium]|nr:PTS sugar transporter subunit IIA [Gammaproteobacteria bacterium]